MIKKLKETIKEIEDLKPIILISIDPGNSSTGIAIFNYPGKYIINCWESKGKDLLENLNLVKAKALQRCNGIKDIVVVIEKPVYYGGRGAVAHASGRIGALYRIEGLIIGYVYAWMFPENVFELTPLEWKGQLSKQVTTKKINKIYELKLDFKKQDDMADAIAIGSRILSEW